MISGGWAAVTLLFAGAYFFAGRNARKNAEEALRVIKENPAALELCLKEEDTRGAVYYALRGCMFIR